MYEDWEEIFMNPFRGFAHQIFVLLTLKKSNVDRRRSTRAWVGGGLPMDG